MLQLVVQDIIYNFSNSPGECIKHLTYPTIPQHVSRLSQVCHAILSHSSSVSSNTFCIQEKLIFLLNVNELLGNILLIQSARNNKLEETRT